MMGSKAHIFDPIDALTLEEIIPADHFYRYLDLIVDLSFVRDLARDCYAAGDRPSVDPVVFFKLQLVMFFEGIRSHAIRIERQMRLWLTAPMPQPETPVPSRPPARRVSKGG